MKKISLRVTLLGLALGGCQLVLPLGPPELPPAQLIIESLTPAPTATVTSTPVPLPILMHPFTIAGMRERSYASGTIHVRKTLETTDAYTRYYIDYPSDGLTITGILRIPKGEGPFPVIVMNHGYFDRDKYTAGDGTDLVANVLNRAGYITVASDYRTWGESDSGPSFFYMGLASDVISLINAVPTIAKADPDRIGLWGHSMGGGITTKVLTIDSSDPRIRAAVLYAPTSPDDSDMISNWGFACLGPQAEWDKEWCNSSDVVTPNLSPELVSGYVTSATDPDMLYEIAPIYHLDLITVPVQIHIGTKDSLAIGGTPPDWSEKLFQGLTAAGKQAEIFHYEGQGHTFSKEPRDLFLQRIVLFFNKYVRNAK